VQADRSIVKPFPCHSIPPQLHRGLTGANRDVAIAKDIADMRREWTDFRQCSYHHLLIDLPPTSCPSINPFSAGASCSMAMALTYFLPDPTWASSMVESRHGSGMKKYPVWALSRRQI